MRRFSQDWQGDGLRLMFNNVRRRRDWLLTDNVTPRQLGNVLCAGAEFALKCETLHAWPVMLKIDISPLCNLRCTYCVHASPSGPGAELLSQQVFRRNQLMSVEEFERLVREVSGKTISVQLYYLGDPLLHPDLDAMCRAARRAGLNVNISSNFSFKLSDQRLVDLITSGLTHFTVCVDGLKQEFYRRTRVGGRIDLVLDNLERLLRLRRELKQQYPRVEVQYIKYQHNLDQLDDAAEWCAQRGVDQFTDIWGHLMNYADSAPGTYEVIGPRKKRRLPQCTWPYFSMVIKYNGDAIPCCYYRTTEQYQPAADSRVVGNVFQTSVKAVWNSEPYKHLRRIVSHPELVDSDPELPNTFCNGCPTIFETDLAARLYTAESHNWEELYVLDEAGRVVRH